jgi:3-dehydroquinate synthase
MQNIIYSNIKEIIIQLGQLDTRDLIFVDKKVYELYQGQLSAFKEKIIIVNNPEASKTYTAYEDLCELAIGRGVHRTSKIYAIGGGALSDLIGFVAATLLRGLDFYIIPTTLLSMVDAAVGGKVAINSKHGKNLIGNFHPAKKVFISTEFLNTLPEYELQCGKGEILKYAFLDSIIYQKIMDKSDLTQIVKLCIDYKLKICEQDLKESGKRKYLNFGHSFGHAIEYNNKISHGQAVLNGIHIILQLYNQKLLPQYFELLEKLDLKKDLLVKNDNGILEYLKFDKKNVYDFIQIISVIKIGEPEIFEVKLSDLKELYKEL